MRNTILTTLLIASTTATANEAIEYEFDMILFENTGSSEVYLSDHAAREFINRKLQSTEVNDEEPAPTGATVYESDSTAINYRENATGELDEALISLERSSKYKVIARKSWTQSGFQDGDSIMIDIEAAHPSKDPASIKLLPGVIGSAPPFLSGSVSFTFSRYIHLSTDLVMDHTAADAQSGLPFTQAAGNSHIVLERKLRSNETHYIDHPLLGVLINIVRVKVQDSES